MKVLVLTKRQYMGKDLLNERFGRFVSCPLNSRAVAMRSGVWQRATVKGTKE